MPVQIGHERKEVANILAPHRIEMLREHLERIHRPVGQALGKSERIHACACAKIPYPHPRAYRKILEDISGIEKHPISVSSEID